MFHRLKNDFRLSIITLLGISGLVGITPFAVLRFMQGNLLAGVVDSTILGGIATSMAYAWFTGDTRQDGPGHGNYFILRCCGSGQHRG